MSEEMKTGIQNLNTQVKYSKVNYGFAMQVISLILYFFSIKNYKIRIFLT